MDVEAAAAMPAAAVKAAHSHGHSHHVQYADENAEVLDSLRKFVAAYTMEVGGRLEGTTRF